MVENNYNVQILIGENADIDGSNLGNINITNQEKTLTQILIEAYNEVISEMNLIQVQSIKRTLLMILDNIKEYYGNNIKHLEIILEQVNCKLEKSQAKNTATLVKLLSFLVMVSYTNNAITIPNTSGGHMKINEKNNWFFNAAGFSEISLSKHISKITDYISRTPTCNINNGNCYIAMLLNYKEVDYCKNCEKGLLKDEYIRILPNIIDSDSNWQDDFFDLRTNKNLILKCGKCTSTISKYEFAKEILEDI